MKRILSILMIFALVFSLASCKGKDAPPPTPVIEESNHFKEFKDENGRVIFTVDVTIPQITDDCDPKITEYINGVAMEVFNDACQFAESNLESAAKAKTPWSKNITFETTLLNNKYACFLMSDLSSIHGDIPVIKTLCFDVQKGEQCFLNDFATYPEDPESSFEFFLNDTLAPALPREFHHPEYITDEVLGRLDEIVDPSNFYLTEDGMGFYFNKNHVHEYLKGIYKITFKWQELAGNYELPR